MMVENVDRLKVAGGSTGLETLKKDKNIHKCIDFITSDKLFALSHKTRFCIPFFLGLIRLGRLFCAIC